MSVESTTRASDRRRIVIAIIATAAIVLPLGWMWWSSRLPSSYSAVDMGRPDYGGGPSTGAHRHGAHYTVSVSELVDRSNKPADVTVDLTARKQRFTLASGRTVDGYTLNGSSPGPLIKAVEGQLVEVTLHNANIADGITLHWHGVDVPNAEDGVAGVTQDAVGIGRQYTYRFIARHAGTYWYHSHQLSHSQVQGGLFGPIVISPSAVFATAKPVADEVAVVHTYDGRQTLNGYDAAVRLPAQPNQYARVRIINTDNGATQVWTSGADYQVLAVDGYNVHEPGVVSDRSIQVTAGGRVDILVRAPGDGSAARIDFGGGPPLIVGGETTQPAPAVQPTDQVDLLSYGTPTALPFTPESATRKFTYDIGRRPGFVNGRPGLFWSINGKLLPDVPMFMVTEGDVVQMHISNHSGAVHPMHLHGHHAVVLARNGVKATGSPWWVDSLNVASGQSYDIAFLADNPGIWMDHCHNLPHAQQGLVAHLMYEGVSEPFRIGGDAHNNPE